MANHCVICDRRWPPEPVNVIVLGEAWIEFCAECADTPEFFENQETGELLTPRELFEQLAQAETPL